MKSLLLSLSVFLSSSAFSKTVYPTTLKEFENVSVKVLSNTVRSGGSGVIYKSYTEYSVVLTNAHVCKIIERGGTVVTNKGSYDIFAFKKFKHHDICQVLILDDLGYSTELAKKLSKHDLTITSGFPFLNPLTIQSGTYSSSTFIFINQIREECKTRMCTTVITRQRYKSNYFTNKIAPGNSGSAIFNKRGRIVGLVFAGQGRSLSFCYGVPLSDLKIMKLFDTKFTKVTRYRITPKNPTSVKPRTVNHIKTPAIYDRTLDRIFK